MLNNSGYTIERIIMDGPFNDIQAWQYHLIPRLFNGEAGALIEDLETLKRVLKRQDNAKTPRIYEITLQKNDPGYIMKQLIKEHIA